MEEDVRLSMDQDHAKWVGKAILLGGAMFAGTILLLAHDCDAQNQKVRDVCSDVVIDPSGRGTVECPDPRQTLSYPPGWTWVRCSCPKSQQ
jgi:LSD1 subclass zinc finger protein